MDENLLRLQAIDAFYSKNHFSKGLSVFVQSDYRRFLSLSYFKIREVIIMALHTLRIHGKKRVTSELLFSTALTMKIIPEMKYINSDGSFNLVRFNI